jgi:hypothetical protein
MTRTNELAKPVIAATMPVEMGWRAEAGWWMSLGAFSLGAGNRATTDRAQA